MGRHSGRATLKVGGTTDKWAGTLGLDISEIVAKTELQSLGISDVDAKTEFLKPRLPMCTVS